MSFLIRSSFWLGLVFLALPWNGEDLRTTLSGGAEDAARTLAGEAQALCLKNPVACAEHAATIARLINGNPSQNTLEPADLAPAWRGAAKAERRRAPG